MSQYLPEKEMGTPRVDDGVESSLEDQGPIDSKDMYRMGKEQVFKVRRYSIYATS
jgi:hypothetical protein